MQTYHLLSQIISFQKLESLDNLLKSSFILIYWYSPKSDTFSENPHFYFMYQFSNRDSTIFLRLNLLLIFAEPGVKISLKTLASGTTLFSSHSWLYLATHGTSNTLICVPHYMWPLFIHTSTPWVKGHTKVAWFYSGGHPKIED